MSCSVSSTLHHYIIKMLYYDILITILLFAEWFPALNSHWDAQSESLAFRPHYQKVMSLTSKLTLVFFCWVDMFCSYLRHSSFLRPSKVRFWWIIGNSKWHIGMAVVQGRVQSCWDMLQPFMSHEWRIYEQFSLERHSYVHFTVNFFQHFFGFFFNSIEIYWNATVFFFCQFLWTEETKAMIKNTS